jgi:hypothetical protein
MLRGSLMFGITCAATSTYQLSGWVEVGCLLVGQYEKYLRLKVLRLANLRFLKPKSLALCMLIYLKVRL